MIAGSASGSSTRSRVWRGCSPSPGRLDRVRRDPAQPGQRVAEEDQQRVGDERDLGGEPVDPRELDEQLEQREARDRVEERGQQRERRLEPVAR